jgi:transposase
LKKKHKVQSTVKSGREKKACILLLILDKIYPTRKEAGMTLDPRHQVDMPTTGVNIRTLNNSHPVYMSVPGSGHRNAHGTPTKDRICIGKMDPVTGKLIPNAKYWERFGLDESARVMPAFGSARTFGGAFLVDAVMSRLGLDKTLEGALGAERADKIKTMALYMIARGNVLDGLGDYCETNILSETPLTSQAASRLFATIAFEERMDFFKRWVAHLTSQSYLVYDVTSFSTYAKEITAGEYGYNRDGDRLPQINFGCYVSKDRGLPVFYITYPGSIVDKSYLPKMMEFNGDLGITDVSCLIMDRGFCSTANIQYLAKQNHEFIIGVEKRHKTTKMALDQARPGLSQLTNRIGSGLYSVSTKGVFYGVTATMHMYYDQELSMSQTDGLYRTIEDQENKLKQKSKLAPADLKEYTGHLSIVLRSDGSFSFERDMDKINRTAKYHGYFCLLSNSSLDKVEVLSKYRSKDVIEKSFDDLKNYINMKRLRTHTDATTDGKLFCAFVGLIVASELGVKLGDFMKSKRMSKAALLREMDKMIAASGANGWRMMNPLTKTQRTILEKLGLTEKDLGNYLSRPMA